MKQIISVLFLIATVESGFCQEQKISGEDTVRHEAMALDEILISGNRIEIPFSDASRDIQVITSEDISRLPVTSVNELLSYAGGVDLRQRGPFGGQADVIIDGGTFEQTLVLLNGVKLLDDQTAHIMMNLPVPLGAIDHIEILRGPAARMYGANALAGAVNIVTKREEQTFISVDAHAGSSFRKKEAGDGSGIYVGGGTEVVGNINGRRQTHLLAASSDKYNGQRYNSALDVSRLFYDGTLKLNEKHSISGMAGYIDNKFGANGFYAAPGDRESEELDKTTLVSLSSRHQVGRFLLMPRVAARFNKDDYRYFKHDLNTARSVHNTRAWMVELNGNLKTKVGELGIGWESRLSRINSTNIGLHHRANHGAYAEFRTKHLGNIIASAGAYANYNTDYGWQLYPGADLAWMISSRWKISLDAGTAQRIPSFTDLYLDQRPGNAGNPDVRPENAFQYGGNISYSSGAFGVKAGYFYRDISEFIDWVRSDEDQPYTPYNLGNNKIRGFSVRINQRLLRSGYHSLQYRLSYNYLSPSLVSHQNEQSKYILESLKHQVIGSIQYEYRNFSVSLSNRYIKRELNKGYDLIDLKISHQFGDFTGYLNWSNISDTRYREIGAVPMPPQWVSIGAKYKGIFD